MWWNSSKSSQYSALGTGSDDLIAEDTKLEPHIHPPRPRWREALLRIAPWIAHFVLLLISSSLLTRATQLYERSQCWSGPPVTHEHGMSCILMPVLQLSSELMVLSFIQLRQLSTWEVNYHILLMVTSLPNPSIAVHPAQREMPRGEICTIVSHETRNGTKMRLTELKFSGRSSSLSRRYAQNPKAFS